jgi:hypothetical protein
VGTVSVTHVELPLPITKLAVGPVAAKITLFPSIVADCIVTLFVPVFVTVTFATVDLRRNWFVSH